MVLLIFFGLLLLFAFPLGEFSRITLWLTLSFSFLDILAVAGAIFWVGKQILQRKFPKSLQARAFVGVIAVFCLSLLVNMTRLTLPQFAVAALYILRFFSFGCLFFMVQDMPKALQKKMPLLLLVGGGLLLLGGYVQYFLYPSLRNLIYFGWDEHFYRMFGTFFDPNFFGLFLVVYFLFLFWQVQKAFVAMQKHRLILFLLLSVATFIGIFLTFSRTSLLALVGGVLVLLWKNKIGKWIVALGFFIGMLGLLAFSLSHQATNTNSIFRAFSAEARIGSAKDALTIFMDDPVIGIGFNAYRYAMYRHHFQSGAGIQEDHGASGADSSLLLVLATSGIIGFGVFCFFLWSHLLRLIKSKNTIGLATFVAVCIGSFFVNGLFYPLLLVWFWTILGITEYDVQ